MTKYACNYALIRFLPYRDAGEFVNVGVALACAPPGFLDFHIETRRYARVTEFFPELEARVYRDSLRALRVECERWQRYVRQLEARAGKDMEAVLRHIFSELTRVRNGVFHFSEPRTLLALDPAQALDELFTRYVRRQFVVDVAHGEEAMRRNIAQSLKQWGIERLYQPARVGTEEYNVMLPFVAVAGANPAAASKGENSGVEFISNAQRAIKPLNLVREDPSEITQHGDDWFMRMIRLKQMGHLPADLLFSVQPPPTGQRCIAAAREVRAHLEQQGATTIDFEDTERLMTFARTM